jgi:hypothetical protein
MPNSFTTDSASFVQRKCGVTARHGSVEPAFADDARANRCKHKTSIKDLRNPYIIHKTAVAPPVRYAAEFLQNNVNAFGSLHFLFVLDPLSGLQENQTAGLFLLFQASSAVGSPPSQNRRLGKSRALILSICVLSYPTR